MGGLWRRPLRVRRSDLQGPPHLVSPFEAQRGGEELDQWLSQGQPPPEVEHPPGCRPPLAPRQDHPWQPVTRNTRNAELFFPPTERNQASYSSSASSTSSASTMSTSSCSSSLCSV